MTNIMTKFHMKQNYFLVMSCLAVLTLLTLMVVSNLTVGEAGIGFGYYMNTHGATAEEGLVFGGISLYSSHLMGLAFGGPVGIAAGL